jgi:hypothetical protein
VPYVPLCPCSQVEYDVLMSCCAVLCRACAVQAEAANPQSHLVLVEDPAEVMDELEAQGDSLQVG